jgi:hypothetical protein
MMRNPRTRRAFLLGTASTLLLARSAAALRIEEDPVLESRYLAACETRTTHDQVIRELVAQLEGDGEVTPDTHAQAVEQVKTMKCPLCGCALSAIDPYPAKF